MPITPRDTARMVAAAWPTSSSPRSGLSRRENPFDGGGKRGRRRKQKSGDENGNEKLQNTQAGIGTDAKQSTAQWLQLRNDRGEGGAKVRRCQIPELIDRFADQRPVFHRNRRRRDCHHRRIESVGNHPDTVDQPHGKPGRRTDNDQQAQNRRQCRRQSTVPAEPERNPFENGIERDRQYRAPNED
jgi:hypothetical protein